MAAQKSLSESLYCEEHESQNWGEIEQHNADYFSDDEPLHSLLAKQRQTHRPGDPPPARKDAVEWLLRVSSLHGFSPATAALSVDYLDRFILTSRYDDRPWAMQLLAVACLSLAAKIEETHVPLLPDLQLDNAKYAFEAKTIQRMELLVLSGLKWRMHSSTPLSFVDHAIPRLGLNGFFRSEFRAGCETLLLSVVSDPRVVCYLPSVLATATMLHVIRSGGGAYEDQLLGVLGVSEGEVDECCEVISDVISRKRKRELGRCSSGSGPSDDGSSSNESWASAQHHLFKKGRIGEGNEVLVSLFN